MRNGVKWGRSGNRQAAGLSHAVIVSGLRRVGKSTLLAQTAHRLGLEQLYYLNFEDDRFLGFAVADTNQDGFKIEGVPVELRSVANCKTKSYSR